MDGYLTPWSAWGTCDRPCDGGTNVRTRFCNKPRHGGKECDGEEEQKGECNTQECPGEDWLQRISQISSIVSNVASPIVETVKIAIRKKSD